MQQSERAGGRVLSVLLDARKIGDGGIGTYIHNLLRGFLHCEEIRVKVLCGANRVSLLPEQYQGGCIIDNAKPYSFDEYWGLGRRLAQSGVDVFHSPHFTLPFGLPFPSVVTVHDLIHLRQPERPWYPILASPMIRSALRRASAVIAVSEATRRDLLSLRGIASNLDRKLYVVPNAISPEVFEQQFDAPAEPAEPYILGVFSNNKPHKGLDQLLEAFRRFKDRKGYIAEGSFGDRLKLVLVGKGTTHAQPIHADVVCCGEVSRSELTTLYREAQALVVSSRMEGFCLPVVEAKALGAPILTTPVPAVLELLGNEDLVCSDFGAAELEKGLRRLVEKAEQSGGSLPRVISAQFNEKYDYIALARQVASLYRLQLVEQHLGNVTCASR